jgi:hypothetical protein
LSGVAPGTATRFTISFTIPLAASIAPENTLIVTNGESPVKEHCDDGTGESPSLLNPESDPGYLCVFEGPLGVVSAIGNVEGGSGAAVNGAVVTAQTGFAGNAFGSWAVTGP